MTQAADHTGIHESGAEESKQLLHLVFGGELKSLDLRT